ncbi:MULTISPECIES: NADH-quinone oxidoreductase subunit K [Novipirellula]|uniref:NAD(P)H-quinone oxidoreductase subunit 4L, chloroplastic n=1 Tax=Novipirellula caenicola TaxID=1536901 RepID=A0ABP9VVZ1_9BACT
MTIATLYAVCGVVLFGIGFYGVVICRHLLRKVISLNLMGSGTFLVLVALAQRTPDGQPDPVPHAMVLTGLVVSVSATALALALLRRLHRETQRTELSLHAEGRETDVS